MYTSPPPCGKARTSAALNSCVGLSQPKRHLGSKNPPILSLEPSSLVLDELHLLLRIGDVLLRNVILQADSLDHQVYMREGRRSENHLRTLELLVRRCGVSFTISPVRSTNCYPGNYGHTCTHTHTQRVKISIIHIRLSTKTTNR